MLSAVDVNEEYLDNVLDNLRDEDKFEMRCEFGPDYKQTIKEFCLSSGHFKIIIDEKFTPIGLFGCEETTPETAEVCLLVTNEFKKHFKDFLCQAKQYISLWKKQYKILHNLVYKHNKQALKWLKILGFKVTDYDDMRMHFFIEE